jgi:rubrerythrin
MLRRWTLDDIFWDQFDPSKADAGAVRIVKAACLVEHNAADYVSYLCNIFFDDPEFCAACKQWGREELQHGQALRRWAELADPAWSFDQAFSRFQRGYGFDKDADQSVRGSRTGELLARCMVEVGTSSFYCALRDGTAEPVLKQICGNIASDEFRHFSLFHTYLKRYRQLHDIGIIKRMWLCFRRTLETNDDELAYAYYTSNGISDLYDRRRFAQAYSGQAFSYYRYVHVMRGTTMIFKAIGLAPKGILARTFAWWVYRFIYYRSRWLVSRTARRPTSDRSAA